MPLRCCCPGKMSVLSDRRFCQFLASVGRPRGPPPGVDRRAGGGHVLTDGAPCKARLSGDGPDGEPVAIRCLNGNPIGPAGAAWVVAAVIPETVESRLSGGTTPPHRVFGLIALRARSGGRNLRSVRPGTLVTL